MIDIITGRQLEVTLMDKNELAVGDGPLHITASTEDLKLAAHGAAVSRIDEGE